MRGDSVSAALASCYSSSMWGVSILEAQVRVHDSHQKRWLYYIRQGIFFISNWIEVFEIGLYSNIRFKNIAFYILFNVNLNILEEMDQVQWGKGCLLIGGCWLNGLQGTRCHSADIHQHLHHKSSWHSVQS